MDFWNSKFFVELVVILFEWYFIFWTGSEIDMVLLKYILIYGIFLRIEFIYMNLALNWYYIRNISKLINKFYLNFVFDWIYIGLKLVIVVRTNSI